MPNVSAGLSVEFIFTSTAAIAATALFRVLDLTKDTTERPPPPTHRFLLLATHKPTPRNRCLRAMALPKRIIKETERLVNEP
jgi:hypothetical protein